MNDRRLPKLRFKGFKDDWEQRKLGEIADKVTEKNSGLQYLETLTNSAEFGIISQRDFFDHDISKTTSLGGYYIVRSEDFVYNPRISVTAPVGPINRNKLGRTGVMSPLYTVFRPHDVDTTYLEHFFKSSCWHSFMNFNGDSGARSDRFSIKDNVFFEMPIPTPDIEEQGQIGECLTHLDHLITLHQRKLEKLKIVKKAMLENCFPKNGEKVPKFRFSGFTGDWEQRKFEEVFIERREKTEQENEDTLLSCTINGMFLNSELFGHFRGTTTIGYLRVKKNDLILSAQNLHLGNANVNLRFEHGIISPAYKVYDLNSCDPEFVQAWVKKDNTKNFFLAATTEGASQCRKNIEWETLGKQTISMASMDEQRQIGAYFRRLDHLITLHQRK